MVEEKNYDFLKSSSSIDAKIKNSLYNTQSSFQQTFLSKSMPDLNEVKIPDSRTYDEHDPFILPPIVPGTGVIDAQVDDQQKTVLARSKSMADLNVYDEDERNKQFKHEDLLQEEVNKLMLKKRGLFNGLEIPILEKKIERPSTKAYDDMSMISMTDRRESNLQQLTDLNRRSHKKLSIAEEYQKFIGEQQVKSDILRAQAIHNSTHEEKVHALNQSRDGFDSFRFHADSTLHSARSQDGNEVKNEKIQNELEKTIQEIEQYRIMAQPVGYTKTFEPEISVPLYSNRDEKKEKEAPAKSSEESPEQNYSIKLYEKKDSKPNKNDKTASKTRKSKPSVQKAVQQSKGSSSYSEMLNNKKNEKKKTTPSAPMNSRSKRKVKSAGDANKKSSEAKKSTDQNSSNKNNATNTTQQPRVMSALDKSGPFCQCSDEESDHEPVDAKHSLDVPIVKPVWSNNQFIPGYWSPNGFMAVHPSFMAPQGIVQQEFPSKNDVNGHYYLPNDGAGNGGFNMPNFDGNGGRYDDCPLAQKYFNKMTNVRDYSSPLVENTTPMMPTAPVGLHNRSLPMMHTPVFGANYTTTGQEFLPPVQAFPIQQMPNNDQPKQKPLFPQSFEVQKNEVTRSNPQSPHNTSSGYSTDEPEAHARPVPNGNKSKQRISSKAFPLGNEHIGSDIVKQNKAMRQKQYGETIRKAQMESGNPKPSVPSWDVRSREDIENEFVESRRAAALNYAKNLQKSASSSPVNVPPAASVKSKKPDDIDRENLLDAIEQMKQRHEQDKIVVQELTAGRPKKNAKL